MKVYQTSDIRNIALVGGAKSGKTTMAEAMAFCGGLINRRGTVEGKNTISDYRDIELDRKYSVENTLMYTEFGGKKINILDVPGFADFQGELVSAFNVVEAAVVVVNAQSGVEVGTEIALLIISNEKASILSDGSEIFTPFPLNSSTRKLSISLR